MHGHSTDPIEPMTLGNMRRLGVRSIAVACMFCRHRAAISAGHGRIMFRRQRSARAWCVRGAGSSAPTPAEFAGASGARRRRAGGIGSDAGPRHRLSGRALLPVRDLLAQSVAAARCRLRLRRPDGRALRGIPAAPLGSPNIPGCARVAHHRHSGIM